MGIIDISRLQEMASLNGPGQPDLVAEVIKVFFDVAPRHMQRMKEQALAGDFAALERESHAMKSLSFNVGAMGLGEILRQIEMAAREPGAARERLPILVSEAEGVYAAVCAELRREDLLAA